MADPKSSLLRLGDFSDLEKHKNEKSISTVCYIFKKAIELVEV